MLPDHEPGEVLVYTGEDEDGFDTETWMNYDELALEAQRLNGLFVRLHVALRTMDRMTNYSPSKHKTPHRPFIPWSFRKYLHDALVSNMGEPWITEIKQDDTYVPRNDMVSKLGEISISRQLLDDQ